MTSEHITLTGAHFEIEAATVKHVTMTGAEATTWHEFGYPHPSDIGHHDPADYDDAAHWPLNFAGGAA